MQSPPSLPNIRLRASLVALLLLLLYLLSYTGLHSATDEMSALAVIESWASQGTFTTNQMEWEQSWHPSQNIAGLDGNLYSKKGLGVSLVNAPLFLLGKATHILGAIQTAKFGGPLLTALTAFFLFLTVAALTQHFAPPTDQSAIFATLAWGIATPAWPYARTLYSEPLAALGLTLLLGALFRVQGKHRLRAAWLAGMGLAVVILAKSANAIVALPAGSYVAFLWLQSAKYQRRTWDWPMAFALPVIVAVGLTILYNWVRFGTLLTIPLEAGEQFSTPLPVGLYGLLLSSGKGIFWYAPLLWLAIPAGWFWLQRGRRTYGTLLLATMLLPTLLYALWFDWPGGRSWGPRMIVWTLPAWILWLAPVLAWLTQPRPRWRQWGLFVLLLLSILAQLPGVLIHVGVQEGLDLANGASREQLLWNWANSPLLTYWRAIHWSAAQPPALDPLLAQPFVWERFPWLAGTLLLLGGGALWLGWYVWRRGTYQLALTTLPVMALCVALGLGWLARSDPRWHETNVDPNENAEVLRYVVDNATPQDLVLLDQISYFELDRRAWGWMNRAPLRPAYIGWLRRSELSTADQQQLTSLVQPHPRLWLLLSGTPEDDPASTTESALDRWAGRGRQSWIGTQRIVEYYQLATNAPQLNHGEALAFASNVQLQAFDLYPSQFPDGYVIDLAWPPDLPDTLRFSVQTLDAQGQLFRQVDGRLGTLHDSTGLHNRVGIQSTPNHCRIILKLYDVNQGVLLQAGKEWVELCPKSTL
ncbi:MAG: hypothetical protein U0175_13130 [Caldilineaceae bacterium]